MKVREKLEELKKRYTGTELEKLIDAVEEFTKLAEDDEVDYITKIVAAAHGRECIIQTCRSLGAEELEKQLLAIVDHVEGYVQFDEALKILYNAIDTAESIHETLIKFSFTDKDLYNALPVFITYFTVQKPRGERKQFLQRLLDIVEIFIALYEVAENEADR